MFAKEIDVLYSVFDCLLKNGRYELVDSLLGLAIKYKDRLKSHIKIGILTITSPAESKLENRRKFYEAIEDEFSDVELHGLP